MQVASFLPSSKQALRVDMRRQRMTYKTHNPVLHTSMQEALLIRLNKNILGFIQRRPHAWVGLTWPLKDEIDLRPLLFGLYGLGARVALPVVVKKNAPLRFHVWHEYSRFEKGLFQTLHPLGAPVIPQLVCVPLLAFNRQGYRLGYGGGFYDRTFAGLGKQVKTIGYGYSWQEVPALPYDDLDIRLDEIVTEKEVISTALHT